jgi:DNA-binding protein HU-beta
MAPVTVVNATVISTADDRRSANTPATPGYSTVDVATANGYSTVDATTAIGMPMKATAVKASTVKATATKATATKAAATAATPSSRLVNE